MRKNTGFSLVELMVVIAIIAIVSAVAIPNMIAWFPRYKLGKGARALHQTLQYAKVRAIKDNVSTVVTFSTGNDSYLLFLDNGNGSADADGDGWGDNANDGVQNGTEPTLSRDVLLPGVQMTATTFTGNTLIFSSRGFPSSQGSISLTGSDGSIRTINVSTAGSINITGN